MIYPFRSSVNKKNTYKLFDSYIKKIYIWLFIANHFSNSACSPQITIYWYLTEQKKILPLEPVPINRENVNTAFTLACPTSANVIYIYRMEEWFKVLIHESFHTFGLDFANMDETISRREIFSIFNINCDLRLSETYTEFWAEVINVLFVCVNQYNCNESMIHIHKLAKNIENKMQNERLFSIFQMCKVLKHYKINYIDLYKPSTVSKYEEKSNVFSYYILKCIILFHYNEFIEWCMTHNNGSFQFEKSQMNIMEFIAFIKKKYNNAEFVTIIATIESWLSTTTQNGWIMDTMRMSISE